jgi:GTP-binding protein
MKITSAEFVRGVAGTNEILENGAPQIAFIGRSNVGKSSIINSLTGRKELARTSASPGHTQEINVYLINKSFYLLDLPGYGYAEGTSEKRERIQKLIRWYLFDSPYEPKKVVLIIDAGVGPTKNDLIVLHGLEERNRNIIIVANKADKIKKAEYEEQFTKLEGLLGNHKIIPYSSKEKIGISELTKEVLK